MDSVKKFQSRVFSSVLSLTKKETVLEAPEEQAISEKRCFIHVQSLSLIIAVAELAIVLYQVINTSAWNKSEHAGIMTIAAVLFVVAIMLLFGASLFRIGAFLVPHMVMQVLLGVSLLGMGLFTLYAIFSGAWLHLLVVISSPEKAVNGTENLPEPLVSIDTVNGMFLMVLVMFAGFYCSVGVFVLWCFRVVLDFYRLLDQQKSITRAQSEEEYCAPRTIQLSLYPNQVVQATDF